MNIAGGALLFIVIALVTKGLVFDVTYQKVRVIQIIQIPGEAMSDRLVIVDLGDRQRPIRTSDRLLRLEVGDMACVAKRKVIFRRWTVYSLELSGYCRNFY